MSQFRDWAEHVREELAAQLAIVVRSIDEFADSVVEVVINVKTPETVTWPTASAPVEAPADPAPAEPPVEASVDPPADPPADPQPEAAAEAPAEQPPVQ